MKIFWYNLFKGKNKKNRRRNTQIMYLNFFESDPKKRLDIVKQIIKETPPEKLTHQYLVYLTDYIIKAVAKDKK